MHKCIQITNALCMNKSFDLVQAMFAANCETKTLNAPNKNKNHYFPS